MREDDRSRKEQENGWGGTSTGDGTGTQMGMGGGTEAPASPQVQTVPQPPVVARPAEQQAMAAKLAGYYRTVKNGGGWFYWIAGFSVVNTLIMMSNGNLQFVIGLGATQFIDGLARGFAQRGYSGIVVVGLAINLVIAGFYVLCGRLAVRRMRAMFVTGMVLYSLDTALLLLFKDWFSVAFHVYALYCISLGFKADGLARQIEAELKRLQPIT